MTEEQPVEEKAAQDKGEFTNVSVDTLQATMEKFLDTANVKAVFAKPIQQGDTTIITCSEVMAVLGFGVGEGSGGDATNGGHGSGGGGGGRTFARPVAAIIASPAGVTIQPIMDPTKLWIAALTTLGFMFAMMGRMRRGRRH
jgi:uncharacterized spore protein YtfJ